MEIGPSLPPHLLKKGKHPLTKSEDAVELGPSLPLSLSNKKQKCEPSCEEEEEKEDEEKEDEEKEDEEKEDEEKEKDHDVYGPALPPHLLNKQIKGPTLPEGIAIKDAASKDHEELKHTEHVNKSDDDDDDDIGPIIGPLPSRSTSDSYAQNIERDIEARSNTMKDKLLGKNVVKQKREEWMTELPPELTKNFGLGPRTFRRKAAECGDRSGWTDTPVDKARKMATKSSSKSSADETTLHKAPWEKEREKHMEQMIQDYNKTNRGESLLEKHQQDIKKQKKEEGINPNERRPFDRDKDLANPLMDPSKRKSLINKSQGLGTRFHHGKSSSSYL